MREIKYLVVHCSATKVTSNFTVEQVSASHKARGFKCVHGGKTYYIGYHYYITKDGVVHNGRPEEAVGAHVSGYNAKSIGICYEGGLNASGKAVDTRTPAQKEALLTLLKKLKSKYPSAVIKGHRDFSVDKNKNGRIDPWERMKECPCFDAIEEYKGL